MKMTLKKRHMGPEPVHTSGQPSGEKVATKGMGSGPGKGGAAPLVKRRPMLGHADHVAPHGQPDDGRDYPQERRHTHQPGHPDLASQPAKGVKKPITSVVTATSRPKTVRHMIRQMAPASHHRVRKEGQVMHETGLKHTGGPSQGAYAKPGSQVKNPGHTDVRNRLRSQIVMENMSGDGGQMRVAKYGSAARFKRLRMTPKSDGGSY